MVVKYFFFSFLFGVIFKNKVRLFALAKKTNNSLTLNEEKNIEKKNHSLEKKKLCLCVLESCRLNCSVFLKIEVEKINHAFSSKK